MVVPTYLVNYWFKYASNESNKHTEPLLLSSADTRYPLCVYIQQPALLPYINGAQICRKSSKQVAYRTHDTFSQPKRILWIKTELLTLHFIQSVIECRHRNNTSLSYSLFSLKKVPTHFVYNVHRK